MLDWGMIDLAAAEKISVSTVKRMEMTTPQPVSEDIYVTVHAALGEDGIRSFGGKDDAGIALRLR